MISTFGCNNGIILAGGRLFQAMANDRLFFQKAAETNKNGVPANSLFIQGIWAIALCFSGSYGTLLDFTVFAILIFYFLTVASVFKTKIMGAQLPTSQKIIFSIYLISLLFLAGNLLWVKTISSTIGLIIVLVGIPFYYVMKKNQRI
jgi:APA family basic amino acid/polyamine antiporter